MAQGRHLSHAGVGSAQAARSPLKGPQQALSAMEDDDFQLTQEKQQRSQEEELARNKLLTTLSPLSSWRIRTHKRRLTGVSKTDGVSEVASFELIPKNFSPKKGQQQGGQLAPVLWLYGRLWGLTAPQQGPQVRGQLRREFFVQLLLNLLRAVIKFVHLTWRLPIQQDLLQFFQTVGIALTNHRTIGNPATGMALVIIGSLRPRHWAMVCLLDSLANAATFSIVKGLMVLSSEGEAEAETSFRAFFPPLTVRNASWGLLLVFMLHIVCSFTLVLVSLTVSSRLPRTVAIIVNAASQVFISLLQKMALTGSTNPAYVLGLLLVKRGELKALLNNLKLWSQLSVR